MELDIYEKVLQIKTNTTQERDEKIVIDMYSEEKAVYLGRLRIKVVNKEYEIKNCNKFVPFSNFTCGTSASTNHSNVKIWSIFVRGDRLKVKCNETLILDHCLCVGHCSSENFELNKINTLKSDVRKISFYGRDKASLEWRNYDASQHPSKN